MKIRMGKQVSYEYYTKIEVVISTEGNYFSITGTTFDKNNDWLSSGCIHGDIMKHYPELEILIELHLCNIEGIPMYFMTNSIHYYRHNNIEGLLSYGFNKRQIEYLYTEQPNVERFSMLVENWGILKIWKYKASLAMDLINKLQS